MSTVIIPALCVSRRNACQQKWGVVGSSPLAESLSEVSAQELIAAINTVSEQVEVLRNVADEIREQLSWAVQNGRFSFERDDFPQPTQQGSVESTAHENDVPDAAEFTTEEGTGAEQTDIASTNEDASGQQSKNGLLFDGDDERSEEHPFVRDDRQQSFGTLLSYDWPEPDEDHNTITVDRVMQSDDVPPHRFTIRRGDTVNARFNSGELAIGKAVGISLADRQVRVRFREGSQGLWFPVGCVYPALESEQTDVAPALTETADISIHRSKETPADIDPPSVPVAAPDSEIADNELEAEPIRPYTFTDLQEFRTRLLEGDVDAASLHQELQRLIESRQTFIEQLVADNDAKQLKVRAARLGSFDANRSTKQQNSEHIYRSCLQVMTLSESVTYQPLKETYEEAITRIVGSITDEMIQQHVQRISERTAQHQQALDNPQTLDDFQQFVRVQGEEALSHDQLVAFDRLRADATRSRRSHKLKPETVQQIVSDVAGLEFTISEGYHDRKQIPLWICSLNQRVDRPVFMELKQKASMLGGWWSSFKKPYGFHFKTPEAASQFAGLLDRDADRSDQLADRDAERLESTSERLLSLADDQEKAADAILVQDRLTNTVRRAEMAAGVRGRAYSQQAFAKTLRSLGESLRDGDNPYLDRVRTMTQLSTLISILRQGKTRRNKLLMDNKGELGMWERRKESDNLDNRPLETEDADFAEYPFPTIDRRNMADVIAKALRTKGLKLRARQMGRWLTDQNDLITFRRHDHVATFEEFCSQCSNRGIDVSLLTSTLEDYKRLQAANIQTLPELRMALRELVPHLVRRNEDDPVMKAEQNLIGMKLPGFFPTPATVVLQMIERAEIEEHHRILEPSAGKGDILDSLRRHHPEANVSAVETNGTLFDVLEAKGHDVERGDFLDHHGEYDRILMNPPFENGAEIDHIRHAYDQLANGGRLVSIMSEGPFFRSDRRAIEFREWFEERGGESEQLPEDAFSGTDAFRKTGVRTRIVVLEKQRA